MDTGVVCTSQGKLTDEMELIDDNSAITLIEGIKGAGGEVDNLDEEDDGDEE